MHAHTPVHTDAHTRTHTDMRAPTHTSTNALTSTRTMSTDCWQLETALQLGSATVSAL